MTDAPHGPVPTVADHRRFTELLERGLTLRQVAQTTGFSYGQVRGAVHRQAESGECPGHGKCDDPGCPAHYAPSEEVI